MKKKLITAAAAAVMTLAIATTAFAAGWKQDKTGWWYQNDDGSYVQNARTPDGYYCNADGYWNWSTNDAAAEYLFFGERLFKTTDFTKADDGTYSVAADMYDTAFFDEGTLKNFKKGNTFALPNIGTQLTVTNVQKSYTTKADAKKVMSYKMTAQDTDGNTYYFTPNNTTEKLAGTDQYVLILRPVAIGTGFTFTMDATKHEPIATVGHRTTTATLLESKTMYYKLHFVDGNTADAIWDSKKNYIGQSAETTDEIGINDIDAYYAQKAAEKAAASGTTDAQ